jgi:hypothetical protein
MHSSYRRAGWSLLGLAALLLSLGFAGAASAQTGPSPSDTSLLTIPAGQTAQLEVQGFCLDFGKTFPTGALAPKELATPELRAALNYAIQKGYVDSNPRQVEQAVWFLSDGTWHSTDRTIAEEIVNNSKTGQAPTDPTKGTTLFDAVNQGVLTATVTFTPLTADTFYGQGTLTIKNTGSANVQVYLPLGTVFPPGSTDQQRLMGYAIRVAQAAPTATAPATATSAPTATAQATATTEATATAQATATTEATAMPTVAAAPTATTTLPQVPVTGAQQLPVTGGPADSIGWWLLIATGLLSLVAGALLLRRGQPLA